jgi:integrase
LEKRLRIEHHYDPVVGLTEPKDGEARTVYLTAPAVRVFEQWLKVRGSVPGPLFPDPNSPYRRIDGQRNLAARITKAMEAAGIPKQGENGRDRKPFHALRASFTRLMLEQGRNPGWVQGQLGHSTADLTMNVYGKWSQAALVAEADSVAEDAFPL